MKYVLAEPIRYTGKDGNGNDVLHELKELEFREKVVAADYRGVPMRSPMLFDDMLTVAGRLCAQPSHVMDRLASKDMMEVMSIIGKFL